ncbi:hypothetical protein WAE61_06335 [Comamonadaceae bacterium PP-2]
MAPRYLSTALVFAVALAGTGAYILPSKARQVDQQIEQAVVKSTHKAAVKGTRLLNDLMLRKS